MDSRLEARFRQIFAHNEWGGSESISGPGSSLAATARVRAWLRDLVARHRVETLLDAPCGDFRWMSEVDLSGVDYIGVEIVREIVARDVARYGHPGRTFRHGDITSDDLPAADLVLCRDALVHLPSALVLAALRNFARSGSRLLVATTFPGAPHGDAAAGAWRPIDLAAAPFSLGAPLELLAEGHPEPFSNKSLGLWRLNAVTAPAAPRPSRR